MSNPFDADDGEILEGFLCPICRDDLKTPERLTQHVEKYHAEEQDLVKSLKDIFSKAKKKIRLNFDETIDLAKSLDTTLKTTAGQSSAGQKRFMNNFIMSEHQEVGSDCGHFSYFKAIRDYKVERYANETNKLIIRLHKLLDGRPTDPVQRKLHEQKKVSWLDGSSVKLCPSCAKSFHLARRQHHCRLCGTIMCNHCSRFLDIDVAKSLADPSASSEQQDDERSTKDDVDERKVRDNLRVCDHCLWLLENRKEMQDSRTLRPSIILYYDRLQDLKKEIEPEIPTYLKMCKSLYEGESIFTISDAGALRGKIGRIAEKIDQISKVILGLPAPHGSRDEALKKAVRLACIQYIKDEMLSLPPLPVETEIKELQEKRRIETELRIETERRLALEAYEKYELAGNSVVTTPAGRGGFEGAQDISSFSGGGQKYASGSAVTTLDNWSGHQASATTAATDPLVEQINIIKGYIKQARAALRFEEVATLEINLRELQQEFYQRYHQKI